MVEKLLGRVKGHREASLQQKDVPMDGMLTEGGLCFPSFSCPASPIHVIRREGQQIDRDIYREKCVCSAPCWGMHWPPRTLPARRPPPEEVPDFIPLEYCA